MHHIFISYSSKDRAFALKLAAALERTGLDVWIDRQDIRAGKKWNDAIQHGLQTSLAMLLIVSPESMASPNVQDEWEYFHSKKKPIIPLRLREAEVHFQLNRLQRIDFLEQDFDTAVNQVMFELNALGVRPGELPPEPAQTPSAHMPASAPVRSYTPVMALIAVAVLVVLLIGGYILFGPDGNIPTPTATESPAAVAEDPTATHTPTNTPVDAPTQTPTSEATTTPDPQVLALTPVSRRNDWQVVTRTFDEVEMVLVPVGSFMMGDDQSSSTYDHSPAHRQEITVPFWIDRYEVTNAQFEMLGGLAANAPQWTGDQRPRERVTWFEAAEFCERRGARLPTEQEWEFAARGPGSDRYPWGDVWIPDNTVYLGNSDSQTSNVGSHPEGESWVGAQDMSGNVWEWASTQARSYPYNPADGREDPPTGGARVITRGGAWDNSQGVVATFSRDDINPAFQSDRFGFRCARDVE